MASGIHVRAAAGTPPVAGKRLWWVDVGARRWGVWAPTADAARAAVAARIGLPVSGPANPAPARPQNYQGKI